MVRLCLVIRRNVVAHRPLALGAHQVEPLLPHKPVGAYLGIGELHVVVRDGQVARPHFFTKGLSRQFEKFGSAVLVLTNPNENF